MTGDRDANGVVHGEHAGYLPSSAGVVIIGGGVNGLSTAFQLAKRGVRDVVVLERRHLGSGATGKSGALVRCHYANVPEARLTHESLRIFRNWDEEVGAGSPAFSPIGFVQVVAPEHEDRLRQNVADQQAIGIDTRVVDRQELREIDPFLYTGDLAVAAYEPGSGFADPNATLHGFARAAKDLAVRVFEVAPVTSIETTGGRVSGVETPLGTISTDTVVVAAGSWADRLLTPLGIDLGLEPVRTQVVVFRWPPQLEGRGHRVVIDAINHSWLRPEGFKSTLIGAERSVLTADPDTLDESVDAASDPGESPGAGGAVPDLRQRRHARRLVRHVHAQPGWTSDHRSDPLPAWPLGDGRRQRNVVQDRTRDRNLPRRMDRRRSASTGRPDAVSRFAICRGRALARCAFIRR